MTKIRELLPDLHIAIQALVNMSADASKLEIMDNDQSSRRLKRAIVNFKNNELAEFERKVCDAREVIKSRPKRQIKNSGINMNKAIVAKGKAPEKEVRPIKSLNLPYKF